MASIRRVVTWYCLGIVGLVSHCGVPSSALGGESAALVESAAIAGSWLGQASPEAARDDAPNATDEPPTLETAPKAAPRAGKDHLEFGPEMADVLQKYRNEAQAGGKLVLKAERSVPRGDPATMTVPVPEGARLRLSRDAAERFSRYRMRDVEAYLAETQDPESSRTAAAEFLRGYTARFLNRADAPTPEKLHELSQQATNAASTDPLVRTYQALLKIGRTAPPEVIEAELLSVAEHLGPYPPVVQVFVRAWLCKLGRDLGRTDPDRQSQLTRAFVGWLAAEAADPQWRECVLWRYRHATSLLTREEQELVLGECLRAGTGDPWLLHYLLGTYYRQLGWYYRGTGFADQVTAAGRRRVEENLPLSALHFRYAWGLDPTVPDAPRQMIFVSGAGFDRVTSPYHWFLRTAAARFDDEEAYGTMLEMLSPRWGGADGAQLAFGQQCLATNRFDTIVPYVSVWAIEKLWSEGGDRYSAELARSSIARYLQARRAAQDAQPDVQLGVDTPWARSALASRMLNVDMPQEAVAELRAIGAANVAMRPFQQAGAMGEYHIGHQMAKFTVDSTAADQIDRSIRGSWPPSTEISEFEPARKLIDQYEPQAGDDFSRRFFRQARRAIEHLEQRASGDWVDLHFDEQLLDWEIYADAYVVDTHKNSLRLWKHDGGAPQLRVRPIVDYRPPIEVELQLEILEPHPYPRAVGLHWVHYHMWMANEWSAGQPLFGIEARLEATASGAVRRDYAVLPGHKLQLEYAALPTTGPHQLRLRLWRDVYEFDVDGYRWMGRLPEPVDSGKYLGIGEAWPEYDENGGVHTGSGFQISNLRMRRLNYGR